MTDLLVLGSGGAGLSATVRARRAGLSVTVVTKGALTWSATRYAQGGVAAALFDDDDSPALHGSDTLTAGAGLCDPDAVEVLAGEGPTRVRELITLGAQFDEVDGTLALGREGGHSVARVVHAGGDATGAEIERALVAAAEASGVEMHESCLVTDLLVDDGHACGVRAVDADGESRTFAATHTIVATGGAGQCFAVTTNPSLSTGDGIAMALRAGVAVADLEFMQFHPTALHHPSMPRPLLSEALRGEGAILRDDTGYAFMADEHPLADLAPRDVVARAISRRLNERDLDHLWLDATPIHGFAERFPTIFRACRAVGLDPTREWLPVAPAAHYLSGGIVTDLDGATALPRLWACGEAACSGVHGANRLASNSLLESLVFAARAVDAIVAGKAEPQQNGALRGLEPTRGRVAELPVPGVGIPVRDDLQRVMTRDAGVLRDAASLDAASRALVAMAPTSVGEANLLAVSRSLVRAATTRRESRGTHTRIDFPETSARFLGRFVFTGDGDEPWFLPLADAQPVREVAVAGPRADRDDPMSAPVDVDAPAEVVRDAVRRALGEDLGPLGDLTASLVPVDASARADVVARVDGVLAGTSCATEVFAQLDSGVRVEWLADDGARFAPGATVGRVSGPLRSVLTGERTALNFLCHLSGVATMTRRFVDAAGDRLQVWETRKTLPGLRALEKAAVRAGGGVNHRGSLSDMVLIKDNHLVGVSIADAVRHTLARWPGRAVEVECDRIDQVDEALAAGATMVLLDNMTPEQVRACVGLVEGRVLVEVSGGVTIENVGAYAGTGADLVSTSVITQSAPALDLAFDITVAT